MGSRGGDGGPAPVSKLVSSDGTGVCRLSWATVGCEGKTISGPATLAWTGVTSRSQSGDAFDHLAVSQDLGAASVVGFGRLLRGAADATRARIASNTALPTNRKAR